MDIYEFLLVTKGIMSVPAEAVQNNYLAGKLTRLYDDICLYLEDNEAFTPPTLLLGESIDGDELKSLFVEYKSEEYVVIDFSPSSSLDRFNSFIEMEWRNLSRICGTHVFDREHTISSRFETRDKTSQLLEEFFLFFSVAHEIGHYLVDKGILNAYSVPPSINCNYAPISEAIRYVLLGSERFAPLFETQSFHEEITCDCFALFVLFNFYLFREGEKGPLMPTINQLLVMMILYRKNWDLVLKAESSDDFDEAEKQRMICYGLEVRQLVLYCASEELVRTYCRVFCRFYEKHFDPDEVKDLLQSAEADFNSSYCFFFKLLSLYLDLYEMKTLRFYLEAEEEEFLSTSLSDLDPLYMNSAFGRTAFDDPNLLRDDDFNQELLSNMIKRHRFIDLMASEYMKSDIRVFHLRLRPIVKTRFPMRFQ